MSVVRDDAGVDLRSPYTNEEWRQIVSALRAERKRRGVEHLPRAEPDANRGRGLALFAEVVMSRGPGKRQQLLLARVKRLKPGSPERDVGWFYLSKLVDEQYRELSIVQPGTKKAVVAEVFRHAAQELAAAGRLRVEKAGRDLVIKPPTPTEKPNTYELDEEGNSKTYRSNATADTPARLSVGNQGLSVGLTDDDVAALVWAVETVLNTRGLCSQADRASLQRVRDHFRSKR